MSDSTMRIIIQAVDKASGTLKGVAKEAKELGNGLESSGKGIDLSFASIAKGAATLAAVVVALKQVFDMGEQGAQVQRLEVSGNKLAASYDGNMNAIVSAVRRASLNTISNYDAMQSSSRAIMLGLGTDTKQLSNLMEIAAFRGRAMGVSTTQAFNDIVTGIGRKSRLILDNLGIIIDAEKAYKDYGDSIGVSSDNLTSAQQTQAYMNAVLQEGNTLMEQAGGLVLDQAAVYERVGAAWKDFMNDLKVGVSNAILPAIATSGEVVDIQEDVAITILNSGGKYKDYMNAVNLAAQAQGLYVDVAGNLVRKIVQVNSVTGAVTGTTYELVQANYALDASEYSRVQSMILTNGVMETRIGLNEDAAESTRTWMDDAKDLEASLGLQAGAIDSSSMSTEELIFKMSQLKGAMQMDAEATLNFATNLGLMDSKSIAIQQALNKITTAFDRNGDGILQASEQTDGYWTAMAALSGAVDTLMVDKSAVWSITVLMNGISMPFSKVQMAEIASKQLRLGGMLADGGLAQAGTPYIVGERGPELFVPNQSGTVIPNGTSMGGSTFKFYDKVNFVLPDNGMNASDLMRQMGVAA